MKGLVVGLALVWAVAVAASAEDGPAPQSIRLVGEATGMALSDDATAPERFVVDLKVTHGDRTSEGEVNGWFAALPPAIASGEVTGTCVSVDCTLSVDLDNGKLSLAGDIARTPAPTAGLYVRSDDDDKKTGEGAVRYSAVAGPIDGLGELAPPGAVDAAELRELLRWADVDQGFSNADDAGEPPDDVQLDGLATWQQSQGRPMTGLILAADLAQLRANAQAAQAAAGWTVIGDDKAGWSAAYPAKLLPNASGSGGERRFASADGRASLAISVGPPMSDDDFSALVDKLTNEAGHEHQSYTRVNGDLLISYVEKDAAVTAVYRNHARGLGKATFSRPQADDKTYELFDTLAPDSLVVKDDPPG